MTLNMSYLLKQIKLEKDIRHKNRFFLSKDLAEYLDGIVKTADEHCSMELNEGTTVFRARLHDVQASDSHVPYLYEYKPTPFTADEMGAPPSHRAGYGRLNPPGIPFLYGALDELTAVAEMRPWVGAYLSVARMRLNQKVRVIDLRLRELPPSKPLSEQTMFEQFWTHWQSTICESFSIPHHPSDCSAYVPTQFITSAFQNAGADGVVYSSAIHVEGHNIALFDTKIATVKEVELVSVAEVIYRLE